MALFTEQMEMLTNELLTSRQERASFVSDVQEGAHKLLADAQTFMHTVSQEHGAMAKELRTELATNSKERLQVVKTLRQQNREHFQSMRKGMRELLTQTRRQRQQHVAELRTECRTAQKDLASDLRQAARVWQRMFQVGVATNGTHKGEVKVTASAKVAQVSPPAKVESTSKPLEHGHRPAPAAKPAIPIVTVSTPPVKAEEPSKHQEHGRTQGAEFKPSIHIVTHGTPPVKTEETGKPH